MLPSFTRIAENTVNRPSIDEFPASLLGYVALLSPTRLITFMLVFCLRLIGGSDGRGQSMRARIPRDAVCKKRQNGRGRQQSGVK